MANSLKNPPATERAANGAKKYLDFAGLNALWDNICDKFAPQWKSVNFDHIAQTTPTHEEDKVVLTFQNLSMSPIEDGVIDHTHVTQKAWEINAATQEKAGVMSAADKTKLDGIESTAENAVTVKTIMIGGGDSNADPVALKVSTQTDPSKIDFKAVAFGLDYDADKDFLSIVDLNDNSKVLSQVHVLGGAFQDWGFADFGLSVKDNKTYLVFTLNVTNTKPDGTTTTVPKTVEILVDDLISTYTAGDGINISQSSTDTTDETSTNTTISLIAPKRVSDDNKIGGIKSDKIYTGSVTNWKNTSGTTAPAIQDLGTKSGRYFGIETDKDGHAFVNVPAADLTIGDAIPQTAQNISNNSGSAAEFTVVSGFEPTLSDDGKTWTLAPKTTKYSLAAEEEITVTPATPVGDPSEINADGGVITYIDGISVEANTHKLSYQQKQVKIKETPLTVSPVTGDVIEVSLIPGIANTIDFNVVTSVSANDPNGHTLEETKQSVKIKVADPEAIDIDYIEGLKWVVPITKLHYRNESDYETAADHQGGSTKTEIQDE